METPKSIYIWYNNKKKQHYLGGLFSKKSLTCDSEGLNKESLAAKASSNGTDPLIALKYHRKKGNKNYFPGAFELIK